VDKNKQFTIGGAWQHALTGRIKIEDTLRPLSDAKISNGITKMFKTEVKAVNPETKVVTVACLGSSDKMVDLEYDYLLVAPGLISVPDSIPGLASFCLNFCDMSMTMKIRDQVMACKAGATIVVMTSSLPYKCPPALFEYAFLIQDMLAERGIRDQCKIVVTTPGHPFPFGGPPVKKAFTEAARSKGIDFQTGISPVSITESTINFVGAKGSPKEGKTEQLTYDVLLGTWPQRVPKAFANLSSNPRGFIPADIFTTETEHDGVFVAGDAALMMMATVPPKQHPKAGTFAAAQASNSAWMIKQLIQGKSPEEARAACNKTREGKCFAEAGEEEGILLHFRMGIEKKPSFASGPPDAETFANKQIWIDDNYRQFFGK
jgi:sulfide:quinone oxidoreductase